MAQWPVASPKNYNSWPVTLLPHINCFHAGYLNETRGPVLSTNFVNCKLSHERPTPFTSKPGWINRLKTTVTAANNISSLVTHGLQMQ